MLEIIIILFIFFLFKWLFRIFFLFILPMKIYSKIQEEKKKEKGDGRSEEQSGN